MKSKTMLMAVLGILGIGCAGRDGEVSAPSRAGVVREAPVASSFYAEKEYPSIESRIYVFGKETTFEASKEKPHLSYVKTFVGGGPGGKTVVIEADAKETALQARLIAEFSRRHGTNLE